MEDERREWSMFAAAALQGCLSAARIEEGEAGVPFPIVVQAMKDARAVADDMVRHAEERYPTL